MDLALEIIGFTVGIVYLWWEYNADTKVWLASMVMPLISMWLYFSKGLYADFAINIYYFLIAIYGLISWTRGRGKSATKGDGHKTLPITHTPLWGWCVVGVASAILWWGIWWVLVTFTDSTVPVADAFTTALSITGMWMMARKFAEQWLIWVVVDIVCVWLYIYKGLVFYPVLYAVYTVIAVFGYRKWLRFMKTQ